MAVVDVTIQNGVSSLNGRRMVRGTNGTVYAAYLKSATNGLFISYSTDSGLNWTEVDSTQTSVSQISIAIDSQDKVHVGYRKTDNTTKYRQYTVTGGWSSEETISSSTENGNGKFVEIAVDSADNIHAIESQFVPAGNTNIYYNKRTSGTWGAVASIYDPAANYTIAKLALALDSANDIYVVWSDNSSAIRYIKYNGSSWSSAATLGNTNLTGGELPNLVVDSSNNVYVIWISISGANQLRYSKYTKSTDSWSAEAVITTTLTPDNEHPSISINASNVITTLFTASSSIYLIQYTSSWGSDSALSTALTPGQATIESTIFPIVGGSSITESTVGYHFTYLSNFGGSNYLRYYSSTDFTAPLSTKNYSRDDRAALPSNDSNLDNLFTATEYTNVAAVDALFTNQTATDEYAIKLFKNKGNSSSDNIVVTWVGQSNIAPSTSPVYLQIYNRDTSTWETLDSDSTSSANANFSLSGTKTTSLSDYYDGSNWVSCRVYQLAA